MGQKARERRKQTKASFQRVPAVFREKDYAKALEGQATKAEARRRVVWLNKAYESPAWKEEALPKLVDSIRAAEDERILEMLKEDRA